MSVIADTFASLLGFVVKLLITLLLCFLCLPICFIVFTPYLLVAAFFSEESYHEAIRSGYYNVFTFWRDYICNCFQL